MVHVAFLTDPVATLNLKKDSTLAMVRAALQRGWRVSCFEQGDLVWRDDRACATVRALSPRRRLPSSPSTRPALPRTGTGSAPRRKPISPISTSS